MEDQKDRLFYRALPATARGSNNDRILKTFYASTDPFILTSVTAELFKLSHEIICTFFVNIIISFELKDILFLIRKVG